jgi:cell division septum initiation protein DivIVA
MDNVASAKINSFGNSPKANFVSPSEQLITLTIGQLQDLVKEAIQPLQDEVESFRATVARQDEKIASLESTQDTQADNQLIQLRLIGQLRDATKKEAQPLQKDRADILRALIAANGGKMLAKDARQKMHLGKEQFSLLISKMGEYIESKPLHQDRRKLLLIIK